MEICKMITLSTAHLYPKTLEYLEDDDSIPAYVNSFGAFVYSVGETKKLPAETEEELLKLLWYSAHKFGTNVLDKDGVPVKEPGRMYIGQE